MRFFCCHFVFHAGEDTEFGFDGHVVAVCIADHLLGEGDVFVVRQGAAVDHHGREARLDAALADFIAVAMVEVQDDLGTFPAQFLCILDGAFRHVAEEGLVGVVACALRHLKDDGGLGLCRGLDDGLQLFHVVEIECRDGVTAFHCLGEHRARVDKAQFFVGYHIIVILYKIDKTISVTKIMEFQLDLLNL